MRIAHVSDLHIRNFKYRDEYRAAFEHLYGQLKELKPHLIVNTGDTVHSKLAVSPELFDDVADHMLRMSEIAPYWLTLGNHDLNLKNKTRTDAISPVVRAIKGRTKHEVELLGPGMHIPPLTHTRFRFWNYDIRGHEPFVVPKTHINVGLYHGSISGCVTDIGFTMEEGEAETSKFDAMDFVMLGDIHKRQSFRDGRIWYPGSLIQQNYGEELRKGFLLWDIFDSDNAVVDFHEVKAPGRFYTIQVPASLDLSGIDVPKRSRVRAVVEGELSPSKRMTLEKSLLEAFDPLEIITPDSSGERLQKDVPDIDELIGNRDKVMLDYLKERGATDPEAEAVVKLFRQYEVGLDADGTSRGTTWKLKRIAWDNMMNYGEGNALDLTKLSGLVGVFAPNASGKSSIFDILLQALFDKTSKDVPRNIDLVNDNKDIGTMSVEFEAAGTPFAIDRSIERIHYGQRKFTETKQWGKTSLDFSSVDESLNGVSRPETEREIRRIIGSFEDFALTSMITQNPVFGIPGGADLLNCRETDRRKILFRFLDLDVFERISNAAKEDHRDLMGKFKGLNREELDARLEEFLKAKGIAEVELASGRSQLRELGDKLDEVVRALDRANASDVVNLGIQISEARRNMNAAHAKAAAESRALSELETALTQAKTNMEQHLKLRPAGASIPLDQLHETMNRLRTQREESLVSLSRNKTKQDQGRKSLVTLEEVPCEGQFPTCKFISEAVSFKNERQLIEQAIHDLTDYTDGLESQILGLEEHEVVHKRLATWEKQKTQYELDVLQLESRRNARATSHSMHASEAIKYMYQVEDLSKKLEQASLEQVQSLKAEEKALAKQVKDARQAVDGLLKGIGAIDAKIEAVRADIRSLDGVRERLTAHEKLLEMCGKNGLPYRILAMILPVINAEIAKILGGIVKFNVFFEDDPEEQTVSLSIRYGDYKSRPLSLGSGAEKFIASLAIRVALLSVSSLPKTDILIIDEGFGKLDPEHLEALQRMFEYLREAFGTVFVVSHVDFMRDIVDHSVEITSQDGYAHVEVT
ncbi:MAG TPA: metallophosphoesterase [Isosphaeraceae bacterium]|nr:metallophosphoesterase [Isosphaeraceae bacterium]